MCCRALVPLRRFSVSALHRLDTWRSHSICSMNLLRREESTRVRTHLHHLITVFGIRWDGHCNHVSRLRSNEGLLGLTKGRWSNLWCKTDSSLNCKPLLVLIKDGGKHGGRGRDGLCHLLQHEIILVRSYHKMRQEGHFTPYIHSYYRLRLNLCL